MRVIGCGLLVWLIQVAVWADSFGFVRNAEVVSLIKADGFILAGVKQLNSGKVTVFAPFDMVEGFQLVHTDFTNGTVILRSTNQCVFLQFDHPRSTVLEGGELDGVPDMLIIDPAITNRSAQWAWWDEQREKRRDTSLNGIFQVRVNQAPLAHVLDLYQRFSERPYASDEAGGSLTLTAIQANQFTKEGLLQTISDWLSERNIKKKSLLHVDLWGGRYFFVIRPNRSTDAVIFIPGKNQCNYEYKFLQRPHGSSG